jgi:hypothetical protein
MVAEPVPLLTYPVLAAHVHLKMGLLAVDEPGNHSSAVLSYPVASIFGVGITGAAYENRGLLLGSRLCFRTCSRFSA